MITKQQFRDVFPDNRSADDWYDIAVRFMRANNINTPKRQAAFFAQIGHESRSMQIIEENLRYSASGLRRTFGKRLKGRDPEKLAYDEEAIGNLVYADRIGNGPESSGDGYRFRGRGVIQLTGRSNYQDFAETMDKDAEDVIDYLKTKEGSFHAAVWFWDKKGLNRFADNDDFRTLTRRINGGTNGWSDRVSRWERAKRVLGVVSVAAQPRQRVFREGSSGGIVRQMQQILGIEMDGKFGPNTKAALKRWQQRNGLTVDGVAGPQTLGKMGIKL